VKMASSFVSFFSRDKVKITAFLVRKLDGSGVTHMGGGLSRHIPCDSAHVKQ